MNGNDVEKIKSALSIEDVISSYIKIDKAGMNFRARCPFHNEKTPSFYISPDRGSYYCFGCNAHGDIFSFVQNIEGLDFKGALKVLAERANITLSYNFDQNSTEKDKIFAILEDATRFYESELQKNSKAIDYLKKRGLSDETIKSFRIGYAPSDWNFIHKHLNSKKYSNDLIEKSGLIKRANENDGRMYDRFRGRIMFPIEDSSGRIIAFSGRILEDDGKSAKYINSPDTSVFDKSSTLFGLSKAKTDIRRLNYSILVEGQMDLIMSHQAEIRNTVASSGTALTSLEIGKEGAINNLGLIKRLSNNIHAQF
jgi:DNA primase